MRNLGNAVQNYYGQLFITGPSSGGPSGVPLAITATSISANPAGAVIIQNTSSSTDATLALGIAGSTASAAFTINQYPSNTNQFGIFTGNAGIGTQSGSNLGVQIGCGGRINTTFNPLGGVTIAVPSSGVALTVNGVSGSYVQSLVSGTPGSTSYPDLNIGRSGSTANTIQQGPNVVLQDITNSTYTTIQHSGGQTEFWQYNGGAWHQALVINAYSSGFTFSLPNMFLSGSASAGGISVPATVAGYLVVSINGTSRKIPYYAT